MMPSASAFSSQLSDFNEQLISLVQPWPLIYDCRLPNFKNEKMKENARREISNEMKVSDNCNIIELNNLFSLLSEFCNVPSFSPERYQQKSKPIC